MTRRKLGRIERLKNSVSGNPRYRLEFTDGSVAVTKSDSDYALDIGNPGVRVGCDVDVEFTKAGRVARIQAA